MAKEFIRHEFCRGWWTTISAFQSICLRLTSPTIWVKVVFLRDFFFWILSSFFFEGVSWLIHCFWWNWGIAIHLGGSKWTLAGTLLFWVFYYHLPGWQTAAHWMKLVLHQVALFCSSPIVFPGLCCPMSETWEAWWPRYREATQVIFPLPPAVDAWHVYGVVYGRWSVASFFWPKSQGSQVLHRS